MNNQTIQDAAFSVHIMQWLAQARGRVKPGSHAVYCNLARTHLLPTLGHLRPEAIDEAALAPLLAQLAPLSPSTQSSVLRLLRAILRDRCRCSVQTPRVRTRRRQARTLSAAEQARLEAYLMEAGGTAEVAMLVALHTGLRVGELCALRWGDLSLERGGAYGLAHGAAHPRAGGRGRNTPRF